VWELTLVDILAAMAFRLLSLVLMFAFILTVNILFYLPFEPESHTSPKLILDLSANNSSFKPIEASSTTYASLASTHSNNNWKKV
jgi:hypothetical protein